MFRTTRSLGFRYWIHDSIAEDTPEYAVYGPDTWGLVDELQGGVIAYFHRESADLFRPFLKVTA